MRCFDARIDELADIGAWRGFTDQLEVAQNNRQKIVEIMGYPAGQAADCFHLLRLVQTLFQLDALGDVRENTD